MKAKKVLSGALAAILLTLTPGVAVCAAVSYTHLTLPTICSV